MALSLRVALTDPDYHSMDEVQHPTRVRLDAQPLKLLQ